MPSKRPQVALLIDTIGDYGREAVAGIGQYVAQHQPWDFYCGPQRASLDWESLIQWQPNGIITSTMPADRAQTALSMGIQVINIFAEDRVPVIPTVKVDDYQVGKMAAEHYLELGFDYFGFCGFADTLWSLVREEGFVETIEAAGYSCERFDPKARFDTLDAWDRERDSLCEWVSSLPRPVAIMGCNDIRARHIVLACQMTDRAIPADVAVIGCDNDQLECDFCTPPLSSIDPAASEIGYLAAERLDMLMAGDRSLETNVRVPPRGVVVRPSSDTLAYGDAELNKAIAFIQRHFSEPLQVDDIVNATTLSRRSLERRFDELLDSSVRRYLMMVRLRHSKFLLRITTLPIASIAEHCGFAYGHRFSAQFKREFDMSPSEFRAHVTQGGSGAAVDAPA